MSEATHIPFSQTWCAVPITREDINHALGLPLQSQVGMRMPGHLVKKIAEGVGNGFFEMNGWRIIADVAGEVAQEYLGGVLRQLNRGYLDSSGQYHESPPSKQGESKSLPP